MTEFLSLAALIVLTVTGTGLIVAGVAHHVLATDPASRPSTQDQPATAAVPGRGRRAGTG